jgi:hypothetical protein
MSRLHKRANFLEKGFCSEAFIRAFSDKAHKRFSSLSLAVSISMRVTPKVAKRARKDTRYRSVRYPHFFTLPTVKDAL